MDQLRLGSLIAAQAGVVARRQVLAAGFDDTFIRKQVRRRLWAPVHPGVYVDHMGPPTLDQRAWAAVLHYSPAALCHGSALRAAGVPAAASVADEPIHVAVEHPRKAVPVPGTRVHRLVKMHERVLWNTSPPQLRLEEAVLDVCADDPDRVSALARLADVCQQRRTTVARLEAALSCRRRLRFGSWLAEVLEDISTGAMSVLEHGYLHRVERAHGLPKPDRQRLEHTEDGTVYRDVKYSAHGLVVELDGRIGHEATADRWDDMDRDLLAAATDVLTIRLGWRHVDACACTTATRLARVLKSRGWTGDPVPCGPDCAVR